MVGEGHVLGRERLAVGALDAGAQLERPHLTVRRVTPAGSQAGRLGALGVTVVRRLEAHQQVVGQREDLI